tara:strand:+ start:45 stop:791 length:747 start_codon:yes stop_codon:yes gene_type:complete
LFSDWNSQGLPVQLVGIGKDSHMSSLGNWSNSNDAPICADSFPFSAWSDWDASQRDLFVLDHEGNVVFHESISSGIPDNLETLVLDLVNEASMECDPNLACAGVLTCCDGLLYPTSCCADNCDEPIDDVDNICGESDCEDGEVNNDNPCEPMECWDGEWMQIIIDCAEQMGVPCDGGVYVAPPEDECCSSCIQYGDSNTDGALNVLDVVLIVNIILYEDYYDAVSDINNDGLLNVLDVVQLVNVILNP